VPFLWNRWQAAHESCAVGVTGTAAMVQVQGDGAGSSCDTMVNGSRYEYHYSDPITAQPVCQYSFSGRQYTVYDEGVFKSMGNSLCRVLANDEVPVMNTPPT
jgi:hypothetical protein